MAVSPAERSVVDLAVALIDGSDARLHASRLGAAGEPTGLSDEALAAVQRVVERGVARWMVTGGSPRPWTLAPPLAFGSATLDLLHWLHTTALADPERPALRLRSAPTGAEVPLLIRAAVLVATVGGPAPEPALRSPWVWLFAGDVLAPHGTPPAFDAASLDLAWLLDVQQGRLRTVHRAWCRSTRAADVPSTAALGEAQHAVLTSLLAAIADHPERARFLADLSDQLASLPGGVWAVERGEAPLSRWQRARRARVGLPRALVDGWVPWGDAWRATGFVDDGYEQAQHWLSRFESPLRAAASLRDVVARSDQLPEVP